MTTSPTRETVHVVVAAGMLQPLVVNGNAYNWHSATCAAVSRYISATNSFHRSRNIATLTVIFITTKTGSYG